MIIRILIVKLLQKSEQMKANNVKKLFVFFYNFNSDHRNYFRKQRANEDKQ